MTRLTPEQIAEIKARHEARKQSRPGTQRTAEELVEFYNSAHEDRAALLSHIESDGWQPMETLKPSTSRVWVLNKDNTVHGPILADFVARERFYYKAWMPCHRPAPPETKEG